MREAVQMLPRQRFCMLSNPLIPPPPPPPTPPTHAEWLSANVSPHPPPHPPLPATAEWLTATRIPPTCQKWLTVITYSSRSSGPFNKNGPHLNSPSPPSLPSPLHLDIPGRQTLIAYPYLPVCWCAACVTAPLRWSSLDSRYSATERRSRYGQTRQRSFKFAQRTMGGR